MSTQSITSKFMYAISSLRMRIIRESVTTYGDLVIPTWAIQKAASMLEDRLVTKGHMRLNGRFERGLLLAQKSAVSAFDDPYQVGKERQYRVQSSNVYKPPYRVDLAKGNCECPDCWKGNFCKHIIAATIIEEAVLLYQQAEKDKEQTSETKSATVVAELPPVEADPDKPHGESIIWAAIRHNGVTLGVEVLNLGDEMATVRALPVIKDDKKLQPQFPFEGKTSLTVVPKKELFHVRIFQ